MWERRIDWRLTWCGNVRLHLVALGGSLSNKRGPGVLGMIDAREIVGPLSVHLCKFVLDDSSSANMITRKSTVLFHR